MSDKPKTLTGDLARGDETQVLLTLQQAGVTPEEYAAIGKDPDAQRDIVEVLMRHRLFTSPKDQINRLLDINAAVWHDPDITQTSIIDSLRMAQNHNDVDYRFNRRHNDHEVAAPEWPASHGNGLYAVTLVYDTGDVRDTFIRNLQAFAFAKTGGDKALLEKAMRVIHSELQYFRDIRLCRTAIPRMRGARWVVCELGRTLLNFSAEIARQILHQCKLMGIGPELPLIAAMHPKWALAMNGKDIPFLIGSDLEYYSGSDLEYHGVAFGKWGVPFLEKRRGDAAGDWPALKYLAVDDNVFPGNGGPGYFR